jgi:hypothetical protein
MTHTFENDALLMVNDAHGIYAPQVFVEIMDVAYILDFKEIKVDWQIVKEGPDHLDYWEAWDAVERMAIFYDDRKDIKYNIWQDGDIWLVPVDCEIPEC